MMDAGTATDSTSPGAEGASAQGTLRWYLVHCKPREDSRALEHLERQGFECYWPTRSLERRRGGTRFFQKEPLFPRYLFIHLSSVDDNWYPIRSTRGVSEIVRCNNKPVPVRDDIVEGIRARLAAADAEPYLKPGEMVRITEGPFSQLEAIFVANDGDARVVLLLNILQKEQRVSFPSDHVRKMG